MGPEAGSDAPDFVIDDATGNEIRLSDYRERLHVVLVFNRGFI
jgi:peroxiredoxin